MAQKIKILGTGCPKCRQLIANVRQAVEETEADCVIEKVTDIAAILQYGVMMTPALVIDDEVKSVGKVLSAAEIKTLLGE